LHGRVETEYPCHPCGVPAGNGHGAPQSLDLTERTTVNRGDIMSGIAAELEHELEFELEGEGESEFELELEGELGLAHELELEHEQEAEHESYFNSLAAMGDRSGRSQSLRRIAVAAAKQALRGATARSYPTIEGELEAELGELEGAYELELEFNPTRRAHLDAMLEHIGHAAAEAATEQEAAEHFLPLIPLAAKFALPLLGKALPFAAKAAAKFAPKILGKVVPNLTRGVANVARTLFRNPSTRPLLHAMPRIARSTVTQLGRRVARGARVTPQIAARTLARQTARTLSNPRTLAQAYRRSVSRDRRYHQQTRRLLGRPSGRPGGARPGAATGGGAGYGPGASGGYPSAAGPGMSSPGGYAPGATGSSPAGAPFGVPASTTGGCNCRCNCQPSGAAAPGIAPIPIPATPPACPTCGR
jgi:hypothetical protein